MTKIIYYQCDKCKKRVDNWKELAIIIFIGKQKELCKKCQEDFKIWLNKK